MLNFLKETRKLINISEPIRIVIGNESCDLDSAVSAVALAYHYSLRESTSFHKRPFLPVMNIPKRDFPVKTEVSYFFQKHDITIDHLIFKDELQDSQITSSSIILVDHHVSPYSNCCTEVFDHRPVDPSAHLPSECIKTIEAVGSCATLIARLILREIKDIQCYKCILELLYGPIIMDTVNFSKQACRATDLDLKIVEQIENLLKIENPIEYRESIFRDLCAAREDVTNLSALQLLYKDMKIITDSSGDIKIALPGFPILVEEFIQKHDATEAVKNFAKEEKCSVVLLIGMKIIDDTIERSIGVININNPKLFDNIIKCLQTSKTPVLDLELAKDIVFLDGRIFQQKNIKATRKHILPIVKKILNLED